METLPFMRRYSNKVIVIKFGGHAMGKKEYVKTFAQDVSLLQQVGILPIVVHGGGHHHGLLLEVFLPVVVAIHLEQKSLRILFSP